MIEIAKEAVLEYLRSSSNRRVEDLSIHTTVYPVKFIRTKQEIIKAIDSWIKDKDLPIEIRFSVNRDAIILEKTPFDWIYISYGTYSRIPKNLQVAIHKIEMHEWEKKRGY